MHKSYKLIFIHGYTASPEADWNPAISKLLDAANIDYVIPRLPGNTHPHAKDWLEIIDREVKAAEKPVILVGFSLGTRAALLYIEQYQPQNIAAVFLIAAFNNDPANGRRRDEHYADFFEYALDLEKVKTVGRKFTVLHSQDDSSIDYQQGQEIAEALDAKLITFADRDHFCEPENAPIIFKILQEEFLNKLPSS